MGNGAGVQAAHFERLTAADVTQYEDIERRCKRGFYNRHTDEFRQDMRDAIKRSRLDILEALLGSGCAVTGVYPLHLAATYGSTDCLELLVAAGYSATSLDSHGRTPLHCCAQCRTPQASSCAEYLALQNKKAMVLRDNDGATPLLTAVSRQNIPVVQILMQLGASAASITDKKGRTPASVAANFDNQELSRVLNGGNKAEAKKSKEQQKIDEARIMQVFTVVCSLFIMTLF